MICSFWQCRLVVWYVGTKVVENTVAPVNMVDKEKDNVTSERLKIYPIAKCHIPEEQNNNFPEKFV
jgi:hypothetical protein